MQTVKKYSKSSKKKAAIIALVTAVCVTVPCAVGAAYAYYVNKQLAQQHEISIGEWETIGIIIDDTTAEITDADGNVVTDMYPGSTATVASTLKTSGSEAGYYIVTELVEGESTAEVGEESNFSADYFTVYYTVSGQYEADGETLTAYSNSSPYQISGEEDGITVTFYVAMNSEVAGEGYYYTEQPNFSSVILNVSITQIESDEPTQTENIADFVSDYSTTDSGNWSYGCATDVTDWEFATTSAFTFTAATYSGNVWTATNGDVTASVGEEGAISGNLAVKYTFIDIDDDTAVKITLKTELTTSVDVRLAVYDTNGNLVGSLLFIGSDDAASYSNTLEYTISSGYSVYVIFNSATAGTLGITIS